MTSTPPITAVILVDHGSRRAASNQMLHDAVDAFAAMGHWAIVEPAHMELAEPDITTAYRRCVERGAQRIVVFPYFLSPGRHWHEDIPRLVADAAAEFPQTQWIVTAPFGLHPGMLEVIRDRIEQCLHTGESHQGHCDVCSEASACRWHSGQSEKPANKAP